MSNCVIYKRVSTAKQEDSGLGLEAQQSAIDNYLKHNPKVNVIAEFTEVESGTRKGKRPYLQEALALCKQHKATLVVSKLDRLGRNVHFLSGLMEAGVEFICLDNPAMNKVMAQLLAVFAEYEADCISKRTKEALAVKKKFYQDNEELLKEQGLRFRLGNPQNLTQEVRAKALSQLNGKKKEKAEAFKKEILPVILRKQLDGKNLMKIAEELNSEGYKSPSGMLNSWKATTVKRVLA